MRRLTIFVLALVGLVGVSVPLGSGAASAATIANGPTATDGQRTLTVSAIDLGASGQTVRVTGSGYDANKGIYVAFCVIPATGQPPSPCGGGVDTSGISGASHWISTNPPPYGDGVATPYGPGGSFDVQIAVSPQLNNTIDCRRVRCAIVTRNDHIRSSDRGQDLFVPVTFAAAPVETSVLPQPAAPSTPTPPTETTAAAPTSEVAPSTDPTTTTVVPTTSAETSTNEGELAAAQSDAPDSGSSSTLVWVVVAIAIAIVAAAIAATVIGRRRAPR